MLTRCRFCCASTAQPAPRFVPSTRFYLQNDGLWRLEPAIQTTAGRSPSADQLLAFSVGFIARPVVGIVFGHYGDRVGRKTMLVLSLLMMGMATFLIGLLPTYAAIGVVAPLLLVTLCFLQGFAVGGEWGGAVLMAVEHAPKGKRGFYGRFPQMGVPAGLLLSTGSVLVLSQSLSNADFVARAGACHFC
jgi:MFS transporter, MHS family, shikimate and dehydroshikimate transport protein